MIEKIDWKNKIDYAKLMKQNGISNFFSSVHVHCVVCITICIPCEYTHVYSRVIQYTDTVHYIYSVIL